MPYTALNMTPFVSLLSGAARVEKPRICIASRTSHIVACTSSPNKDSPQHKDIIDGGNFVIKKTYTIHGPSFVMVRRAAGDPPARRPQRRSGSLVPYQRAPPSLSSDLHVSDLLRQSVDITKFSVLVDDATDVVLEIPDDAVEVLHDDDDGQHGAATSECTGIVWVGSPDNTAHQVGHGDGRATLYTLISVPCTRSASWHPQPTDHRWSEDNDPSPRRTSRLHFTCNMCGHRNEKLVNPRAWHEGTVFARCDGCSVVHKLKDNLNLIDEIVYARDDEEAEELAALSADHEDAEVADAYAQGLPRVPFVVTDLVVPPGLVVEPDDPLSN